jgi:dolichol-phosphate mannosyltransferase
MRPLVILPTYNERENIDQLIPAVMEVDPRLDILVVDDASPDDTARAVLELEAYARSQRVFLQTRPGKLGLAGAYIQGFKWGLAKGYDFLIQMDADWSHPPAYLGKMLQLAPESDFVIGSRYVPGGGTRNWRLERRLLSRFASLYSRLVLGMKITDITGGFNGWPAQTLRDIGLDSLRSEGYSFQIELKYRAWRLGYRPAEFPILFDERREGKSKMSASIAFEACWRVWKFKIAAWKAPARDAAAGFPANPSHGNREVRSDTPIATATHE